MDRSTDFFNKASKELRDLSFGKIEGRVEKVESLIITARLPGVSIGDLVSLGTNGKESLQALVSGFRGEHVLLTPFGSTRGISSDWKVWKKQTRMGVRVSQKLIGRIVDGLGNPIDGKPLPEDSTFVDLDNDPPNPLTRLPIKDRMETGIRSIDGLLTLGLGQRIGLFAGSGVGKSTLMGMIARNSSADINVVCLVGERGREVNEFIEESLGEIGMKKSVLVISTSDNPAQIRAFAPLTATAIAEFFREQGKNVLLFVDSITRYTRAMREVALSLGEAPARRGYPPSVFAGLPRLLERTGNSKTGSITAVYTVLVEGGDMDEPVADEVRGIVDGHLLLSRDLASLGHYPAIDVASSISRVMSKVITSDHNEKARKLRGIIGAYNLNRDLIRVGAYEKGTDPMVDFALENENEIVSFLQQNHEIETFEATLEKLNAFFT